MSKVEEFVFFTDFNEGENDRHRSRKSTVSVSRKQTRDVDAKSAISKRSALGCITNNWQQKVSSHISVEEVNCTSVFQISEVILK